MDISTDKCPCGRGVRYSTFVEGALVGSCNKYARCKTYDQLLEGNKKLKEDLTSLTNTYCKVLYHATAGKMSKPYLDAETVNGVIDETNQRVLDLLQEAVAAFDYAHSTSEQYYNYNKMSEILVRLRKEV